MPLMELAVAAREALSRSVIAKREHPACAKLLATAAPIPVTCELHDTLLGTLSLLTCAASTGD